MKRHLFTIFSAISMLLFVAVSVMWVRSYWVGDRVVWVAHGQLEGGRVEERMVLVGWENGQVYSSWGHEVFRANFQSSDAAGFQRVTFEPGMNVPSDPARRAGFHYRRFGWPFGEPALPEPDPVFTEYLTFYLSADAPCWSLGVLTAFLPALACAAAMRRRWRGEANAGTCRVCGYDLRATPERCPECGEGVPI